MGGRDVKIPLSEVYVGDDTRVAVDRVLKSGWFVKGEENAAFEKEFASFVGARNAIAVSSGTAALLLALQALGLRRGDEVLVPSFSFVATVTPILVLGAKPVFVDIDPETFNMDPTEARKKVTKRTRGVLPVHLYGHPADLAPLRELAHTQGLWMLEDACQAHGARYDGGHVGTFGDVGVFSFYPSKNMTVCGDGGMVVTDRDELAGSVRMLTDAGRGPGDKYVHRVVAGNYRLSEIAAAVGRVQLRHLPGWVERRRAVARAYTSELSDLENVKAPVERKGCFHSYYVYTIRVGERDKLAQYLAGQGIATGQYYPTPIHRQPCVPAQYRKSDLPNTDRAAGEVLSLPIFPTLPLGKARVVAKTVAEYGA
jgi:dTDP-4-amino-4,6-dideoxygalactose transaminase